VSDAPVNKGGGGSSGWNHFKAQGDGHRGESVRQAALYIVRHYPATPSLENAQEGPWEPRGATYRFRAW